MCCCAGLRADFESRCHGAPGEKTGPLVGRNLPEVVNNIVWVRQLLMKVRTHISSAIKMHITWSSHMVLDETLFYVWYWNGWSVCVCRWRTLWRCRRFSSQICLGFNRCCVFPMSSRSSWDLTSRSSLKTGPEICCLDSQILNLESGEPHTYTCTHDCPTGFYGS